MTIYLLLAISFKLQKCWSFLKNALSFSSLNSNHKLIWVIDSIKDIWGFSQRIVVFNYNLFLPPEETIQNFIKAMIHF